MHWKNVIWFLLVYSPPLRDDGDDIADYMINRFYG
jgi:hypothetical protein